MKKKVVVIGGGASGFFAAINIAEKHPEYQVTLLEKSGQVLGKVKVSGGGRCNVTNARTLPAELVKFYPRGEKKLYPLFKKFSTDNMVNWLQQRGVKTHTEADQRMFPLSNSSQTIINCFLQQADKHKVKVLKNCAFNGIARLDDQWEVRTQQGSMPADAVVMATGSSPAVWKKLNEIGLETNPAVPSLFTFNIKDERLAALSGISFPEVEIKIAGTKLQEKGPLLITHWGLSGPAVLKLSAWGARLLAEQKYQFEILVNFAPPFNFDSFRAHLQQFKIASHSKKIKNFSLESVPKRYWERLLQTSEIDGDLPVGELPKKAINKLSEEFTQAKFEVKGKSTFKEEFVTCGGVTLAQINTETMESRKFPGLFFSGEVLDIDALTGGFNFQSCWTTAWIISESV